MIHKYLHTPKRPIPHAISFAYSAVPRDGSVHPTQNSILSTSISVTHIRNVTCNTRRAAVPHNLYYQAVHNIAVLHSLTLNQFYKSISNHIYAHTVTVPHTLKDDSLSYYHNVPLFHTLPTHTHPVQSPSISSYHHRTTTNPHTHTYIPSIRSSHPDLFVSAIHQYYYIFNVT